MSVRVEANGAVPCLAVQLVAPHSVWAHARQPCSAPEGGPGRRWKPVWDAMCIQSAHPEGVYINVTREPAPHTRRSLTRLVSRCGVLLIGTVTVLSTPNASNASAPNASARHPQPDGPPHFLVGKALLTGGAGGCCPHHPHTQGIQRARGEQAGAVRGAAGQAPRRAALVDARAHDEPRERTATSIGKLDVRPVALRLNCCCCASRSVPHSSL